jgi:hypothetical protein
MILSIWLFLLGTDAKYKVAVLKYDILRAPLYRKKVQFFIKKLHSRIIVFPKQDFV